MWAGSNSVGIPCKRWIDTVKECLKKSWDVRRMVQDRSEWRGSDEMPELYEALEGWRSFCGQAHKLRI